MKRAGHLIGLKEGKIEQLFHGCRSQRLVLFGRERRKTVPRLRCDDDRLAATCDDFAELFQYERHAIEVHFQDGRR